eukprot:2983420-Pleurochrysis_carterae.AAC.1
MVHKPYGGVSPRFLTYGVGERLDSLQVTLELVAITTGVKLSIELGKPSTIMCVSPRRYAVLSCLYNSHDAALAGRILNLGRVSRRAATPLLTCERLCRHLPYLPAPNHDYIMHTN